MENTENKTELTTYGDNAMSGDLFRIFGKNIVSVSSALFVDENKVKALIDNIADIAKEQEKAVDLDNPKELKKLSKISREVASLKVKIDDFGKSLVEDAKKQIKVVDNNRKLVRDNLDALRDKIRQPLTDFENAEKARIQAKDNAVRLCSKHKEFLTPSADELKGFLSEVEQLNPADFGEFAEQITVERQTAIDALKMRIEKQEEIDRQAEENARLKAEAEKARIEQEKQAYAEEQARKAVEMERQRKEQEERQKAEEQARIQAEEERRKANIEHRKTINNKIVADLMTHCGVNEETAKNIVTHIVKGNIANVCVNY
ncbi:MAG: hypothetical protein IKI11_05445 [Neisseriaceae bacterium]|nr:hypothetical protein [Neisseriaceae bacterium]